MENKNVRSGAESASPVEIRPFSPTEIYFKWSDGMEVKLGHVDLRYHCPCAGCVDEHTGLRKIKRGQIKPDIKPKNVSAVGRYAIAITWTDNHSTGIYHFDRLHNLCVEHASTVQNINNKG